MQRLYCLGLVSSPVNAEQDVEPPGPGAWHLDTSHLTTSCSTYSQPLWQDAFLRGFGGCLRRYGSLLKSLDWAWVEGFPYFRIAHVAAPEGATQHPPREVWDKLMAEHPEVRERLENAERAFEQRIWREDIERWDRVDKPGAIAENQRLLAVDPDALDTAGLVAYLGECTSNVSRGVYLHHDYNMAAFIPAGDLIAQGTSLSGRSAGEVLCLLQGSTPDALGTGHLRRRLDDIASQPDVRRLLESDDAPAAVDEIAVLPGEAGDVLREVVSFIAYRPVNGEDVGDTCAFELPELVLAGIAGELDARLLEAVADPEQVNALTEEIRAEIAPDSRERFDGILEEARMSYRIREERAMYGDLWSYGVARRALIAAGGRLVRAGRLEDPRHLVEASWAEIQAILEQKGGPEGGELTERARYRVEVGFDRMPPHLGDAPGGPLPAEWLPEPSARMEAALGASIGALFGDPNDGNETGVIEGVGVSGGVVEGPARIIDASSDFARIQEGDVLVTRATTAAFNIVLPLLKGIVTDGGGLLCHAAVVSREYSIPAVVGTGNATSRVADGVRVRIDGTAGTVTVLP